jgi:light-regulated signal transduction histidine kinase (bacteriophytochrome)
LAQQQFANETLESTVTERTSQLARINERLHSELLRRETAEKEIRELNAQLERRVQERTGELESANKELATFAYSVSHDLRAPLRGIDGWSLALLEDYANQLDSTGQQYLARVRSETQRMGNLIDDMLLLSRLARDEMTLSSVDLSALARGIAENLRDRVPERSIEFAIAPGLAVPGDQRLLEIALTNLLSNAVKFTAKRDKARIEFGESRKNGEAAFYVRDNGAGFDMNYASHLFGAFQRLHKESEFPGNGIGLATVQRVVSRHGGRVWAEAQIDAGATFWFTVRCPSK